MPNASPATVTGETETHYNLAFTIKGKNHVATIEKKSVSPTNEIELKEYFPAIGETVFVTSRTKMSDWIRGFKKEEHNFLLTQLGKWFEYVGYKEDVHGAKFYKILIPESPNENKVYEIPVILTFTY